MCKGNAIGTDSICPICGTTFLQTSNSRPKEYCSDNCKDFNKYFHAMERKLIQIKFKGKSSNLIKGQLFRTANLLVCES